MNDFPGISRRIGNRLQFALEFEVAVKPPGKGAWGCLWLWAGGRLVGRPSEVEIIGIGLDSLGEAVAIHNRISATKFLSTKTPREALETVMEAHYGEIPAAGSDAPVFPEDQLVDLEILPSRTGPFFAGWEAILLDDGVTERFIFRQEGESEPTECAWPTGTFASVVTEAHSQFEAFVRSLPSA